MEYSCITDFSVALMCIALYIAFRHIYNEESLRYELAKQSVVILFTSCVTSYIYNVMLIKLPSYYTYNIYVYVIYLLHDISITCLLFLFIKYTKYILASMNVAVDNSSQYIEYQLAALYTNTIITVLEHFLKIGFYIEGNKVYNKIEQQPFMYFYFYSILIIAVMLYRNASKLVIHVLRAIIISATMAVTITLYQLIVLKNNLYYINLTFLIPILMVVMYTHSTPYDIDIGALNVQTLYTKIATLVSRDESFKFIYLYMDLDEREHSIREIKSDLLKIPYSKIVNGRLYRLSTNELVFIVQSKLNNDLDKQIQVLKEKFMKSFNNHQIPYKILYLSSNNEKLTNIASYLNVINYFKAKSEINTITDIDNSMDKYYKYRTIQDTLLHIVEEKDLDNPNILVYCQPIYDVKSKTYKSAEALIRMKLGQEIIHPDKFIPIAESMGIITDLTYIITNKVCKYIKYLNSKNINIERISVNFSILDLQKEDFTTNILKIIFNNEIKSEQLGIEITESQAEDKYEVIQRATNTFSRYNIKMYLDDFGTGYSNLNRMAELNFSIIKFDKSLLRTITKNTDSSMMLQRFAKMLKECGYLILFEGIETDEDEELCKKLGVDYTQGYKYSRPVPIEQLEQFLTSNELDSEQNNNKDTVDNTNNINLEQLEKDGYIVLGGNKLSDD